MDKKGKRGGYAHKSVPKKRKFCGNRYSFEADTEYASTSARRLNDSRDEFRISKKHSYSILNFFRYSLLSMHLLCVKNVKKT